jgi:microcystin-dependent protein
MDRIFESNALANTPPAPPIAPSSGYPTTGNPSTNTPATKPGPWWFYMVSEELRNVVNNSGLTPDHKNLHQLAQAIQTGKLIAASASASADALTASFVPAVTALSDGLTLHVRAALANATNTPSFTPNSGTVAAKTIVKGAGAALAPGDIAGAGHWLTLQYDSALDKWVLCNPYADPTKYVPTGTLHYFAGTNAPDGYLKANGTAVSRSTYASLFNALVGAAGFAAQTFSVTLATPAVFTKTAHGLTNGARLRLSTTGALPTGLNTTTDYFVEIINADTFWLNTSVFLGTRVNTSGTQSGTHSYLQSWFGLGDGLNTFNLPDLRGEFLRGWDDGRGVDAGRVLGAGQDGTIKAHNHASPVLANMMPLGGDSNLLGTGPYRNPTNAYVPGLTTDTTGGTETRPRNIALLACIKY